MVKRLFLLLALLSTPLINACSEARAQSAAPAALSNDSAYTRIGGSHWGRSWEPPTTLGTATDGLVLTTPADVTYAVGDPRLWGWGSSVRISCDADAMFAFVMDTSVTIAATGLISDAAPMTGGPSTGSGNIMRVEAGTYLEEVAMRSMFPALGVGRRTGFCSPTTLGAQYAFGGWPCDADADCPSSGACRGENNGSCVESSVNYCSNNATPFGMIAGVFLQSIGAGTENCFVTNVR